MEQRARGATAGKLRELTALLLAPLLLSSCGAPIGTRCTPSDPCPSELVCSFSEPQVGDSAPVGVCDHPLLELGAPCSRSAECLKALTCSVHFEPGSRRGVCVERRHEGEACWVDRDCLSERCEGGGGDTVSGSCGPD